MTCKVDVLLEAMETQDLTMTGLAQKSKLAWNTIEKAMNGEELYFKSICALASALNLSVQELASEPLTPGKILMYNRITRGLSREDLSDLSDVPDSTIAGWECDKSPPNLWNAYHVSRVMGLTINECFGLDVNSWDGADNESY